MAKPKAEAAPAAASTTFDALASIANQIAALETMDLMALREAWRQRLGLPPQVRSPELLRLNLAWRIQAEAWGGLDAGLRLRLRRGGGAGEVAGGLQPGVRLIKEWRGVRHEVTVAPGGFTHAGRSWNSLSQIARAITGVRCNGPKFFGLRGGEGGA